jgi:hypothetical protein
MPVPEEPEVQKVRATEERSHAETRDAPGGNRKTNEPGFVAPDKPAHMQGNAAYKFKLRNCSFLWS